MKLNSIVEEKQVKTINQFYLLQNLAIIGVVGTVSLCPLLKVEAATLNYWRFEDNPGFLVDSAGSSNLTGAATQTTLPGTGAGSAFPNFLSVPGGGGNFTSSGFNGNPFLTGLTTTITPITTDFTVEAFINLNNVNDQNGFGKCIVCSATDPRFASTGAFGFEVRLDGLGGTQSQELVLITSDGTSITTLGSGFVLDTDIDYYVASAFDLTGNITFWIQDLTNDGSLQTFTNTHSATALNPISKLTIGDDGTTIADFAINGLIDEVRISDSILTEDQLLIRNTSSEVIPEPLTILGTATALGFGALFKRKNTFHKEAK